MDYSNILVLEDKQSISLTLDIFFAQKNCHINVSMELLNKLDLSLLNREVFDLIIISSEVGGDDLISSIRALTNAPIIASFPFKQESVEQVVYLKNLADLNSLEKIINQQLPLALNLEQIIGVAELGMPEPEVLISRLVNSFKTLGPQKIKEIESFFVEKNLLGISKTAHALRSTCYNIGAFTLANSLRDLEDTTRNGVLKYDQTFWLKKLNHEFKVANLVLDEIIEKKQYLPKT